MGMSEKRTLKNEKIAIQGESVLLITKMVSYELQGTEGIVSCLSGVVNLGIRHREVFEIQLSCGG